MSEGVAFVCFLAVVVYLVGCLAWSDKRRAHPLAVMTSPLWVPFVLFAWSPYALAWLARQVPRLFWWTMRRWPSHVRAAASDFRRALPGGSR